MGASRKQTELLKKIEEKGKHPAARVTAATSAIKRAGPSLHPPSAHAPRTGHWSIEWRWSHAGSFARGLPLSPCSLTGKRTFRNAGTDTISSQSTWIRAFQDDGPLGSPRQTSDPPPSFGHVQPHLLASRAQKRAQETRAPNHLWKPPLCSRYPRQRAVQLALRNAGECLW